MGAFLTYALDENDMLTHVDVVPNGVRCKCHCPHCDSPLYAKNGGQKRTHHFAHAHGIRDLQVAFKNVNAHYASTIDSLKWFYNEGKMKITLQVGSKDDSLAMANTKKYTQKYRGLKKEKLNEKLHELYLAGEQNLVFEVTSEIPVKDTLFTHRTDFCVDSLAFIPFSGDSIIMESTVKKVSGVNVPLFEASMPFKSLLKGLNNQLRINLDAEREDQGRYQGLQVGSVTQPNNNAGNWE